MISSSDAHSCSRWPAAAEQRLGHRRAEEGKTGTVDQARYCDGAPSARQGYPRVQIGLSHGDSRIGSVKQRLGPENVGSLAHEVGRETHRRFVRQPEGRPAGTATVARHREVGRDRPPGGDGSARGADEVWEAAPALREVTLLRDDIQPGDAAKRFEALDDLELSRLQRHDCFRGFYLCPRRRFLNGRGDDIAGEDQASASVCVSSLAALIRFSLVGYEILIWGFAPQTTKPRRWIAAVSQLRHFSVLAVIT